MGQLRNDSRLFSGSIYVRRISVTMKPQSVRITRRKTLGEGTLENQKQIQPTYRINTWNRTRATLVGDECSHHMRNSSSPILNGVPAAWNADWNN